MKAPSTPKQSIDDIRAMVQLARVAPVTPPHLLMARP